MHKKILELKDSRYQEDALIFLARFFYQEKKYDYSNKYYLQLDGLTSACLVEATSHHTDHPLSSNCSLGILTPNKFLDVRFK